MYIFYSSFKMNKTSRTKLTIDKVLSTNKQKAKQQYDRSNNNKNINLSQQMTSAQQEQASPFGKYQRLFAFAVMLCYQMPFFVTLGLFFYSVVYLDYTIWLWFIVISIVQYPVTRCQPYINFVNTYINPLLYFKSFKRIFEQPIPHEQQKCMFSFHPHGVFAYGLLSNMNYHNNDALSRMSGLSSRFMLNMPITGLLLRLWGLQAVNPENLKRLMSKHQNIGLLPGGFEQATLTTRQQLRIFIENRKGFIKYALKYNYTLYPTLVLNEHQVFWTFDYWLKFRMLLNKIKMPAVLFFHPKSFVFYPSTVEFITVVGKGLTGREYKENQEPSVEEIEHMHKRYVEEVKRMYEKHKQKNGNKPLVIF